MPESTPFIIYMNFLVASTGYYGAECVRENDNGRYFAFGEPVSTPAKIINLAVAPKFTQMVNISFSWNWERINGKQTQKWSEGHMCTDGVSCNEK